MSVISRSFQDLLVGQISQIDKILSSLLLTLCHMTLAAVTSGLLTIVKTGITIVSHFGNVTASLFALTRVRKFTPR